VPRFRVSRTVDPASAERLLRPRDDIVGEVALDDGRFGLRHGPFDHYERQVTTELVAPVDADGNGGGAVRVTQTVDFRLPAGAWRFLLNPAVRYTLKRPPTAKLPWWYPPQRPDARGATVLGLLASLAIVAGYLGTLLTQTMTFAADEFGAGTGAQGNAFAAVRLGGLLAIALGAMADRRGRRLILTGALLASIVSTLAGALAPNLAVLAATQTVNRGAWAAAGLMLAIIAAEEMPAGARAYALSLLAMAGALGAGVALWLLPIADLGPDGSGAWRVLYLVPLAFLPVVVRFGRLIPESRRYERPHPNVRFTGHYHRLALLAGTAFLLNLFGAPQSQFRNEFLRDERGMTAAAISLFVLVTSTPAGIGIVAGGRLADTRGRRVVGATGITVGTLLTAASFGLSGPWMWVAATLGGIFSAALVPTITVYGPELFPTSLRGRANGIVTTVAMGGSVVGLVAAGHLRDALGSFGRTLGILAVGPLVMAGIILLWFPETARRELEDLNPEDRLAPEGAPPPPAPAHASFDPPTSG
jgi:MFS family permease